MSPLYLIVFALVVMRLAELVYAGRNTRRLMAQGGVEIGASHYPLFILLHGSWLIALALSSNPERPLNLPLFALFLLVEAGRVWVLVTLGRFFTTRVITLPGEQLVRRGPYRFANHPNYLVVIGEIGILPLVFGNWPVALIWSVLNLCLLKYRIGVENSALAPRRAL